MNQEQIDILKEYRHRLLFFIQKKRVEYCKEDENGKIYTVNTDMRQKKEFDLKMEYERVSELLAML